MSRYVMSVFSTKNVTTGKTTYYKMVCDAPRRISKANFDSLCEQSNRSDSYRTVNAGQFVRQYKSIYFNYVPNV